jgi:hypothetical protein
VTGSFLTLALFCPLAPPADGGLQRGDELTFVGTVEEFVDRPGAQFRRLQQLEIRVLVLERTDARTDAAVLTLLRRTGDAVTGAVPAITGATPDKAAPPATRLDLVRVRADGSVQRLAPGGQPPLVLDADTPVLALPAPPLDTFAPFEFGMFPPRPPQAAPDRPWALASADPGRPAETWQVQGAAVVTGERCARLVANQQHPNWARPVGGQLAWHRADAVWVSALDGTARKVHRVIRHRDGLDTQPAAWVEVKYEQKDQSHVSGRGFDRYRRDVETAFATAAEVAPLLPEAGKHGPKVFEARIRRLDQYLQETDSASPYREAVLAVRRQLDAARRGEAVGQVVPAAPAVPKRPAWPERGHPAPDFTAGPFRLADARGKPAVLVFFQPGAETADLALAVADALHAKYGTRAAIVPLAVWGDATAGVRDRDRRKLSVPIYDGTRAEAAYGVESVPRFAVLDARGTVKWTFTGVGAETGYSAREQLERLLAPTAPAAPVGTTRPPGPGTGGREPRP